MTDIAVGYFVEQAFGLVLFSALSILFLFQLVMQRKAKFDERQLTQRQRVEDWKKVAAAPKQHKVGRSSVSRMIEEHKAESAAGSKRNSIEGPISPTFRDSRRGSADGSASAPHSPRESVSDSHETFSSNPSTDGTDSSEAAAAQNKSKPEVPPTRPPAGSTWSKQNPRSSLQYNVTIPERGNDHAEKEKRPRIGMVQIVLHRIGFVASVLKVVHFIDPHSVLGIFPWAVAIQIAYMVNGLLFICAIFAFLYPLHLIRVLSLNNRSRTIFFIGVSLSVLTALICFCVPIAYHFVGPLNYLRAIIFLWLMIATVAITVVLDIYSPRLIASLQKLIEFHSKGPGKVTRFQGSVSNNNVNLLSNPSTTTPSPADSPVQSPTHRTRQVIQLDAFNSDTAQSSAVLNRSTPSAESIAQRETLLSQNLSVQGSNLALSNPLAPSVSATAAETQSSNVAISTSAIVEVTEDSDNNNRDLRDSDASPSGSPIPLIASNVKSSSSDSLDNMRSEDSSPSNSTHTTPVMTFASLKSHMGAPVVPALSLNKLAQKQSSQRSNHHYAQTSLVQYTVSDAVVSIHDPAIPSIPEVAPPPAAQPVSANKGYKVGQRRSVSRSVSESRKRRAAKNPVIRQYKKLIARMRLFQIVANVIMALLLIGLLIGLTGQLKAPLVAAVAPSPTNFLEAIINTIYDVVLFLGLSLGLWFAYIPGSCSQLGCSSFQCTKASFMNCLWRSESSTRRRQDREPRDERRLSFHSVTPPPPGGRSLGNEQASLQLAIHQ